MKRFLIFILALFILLPGLCQAVQVTDVNLQNCIGAAAGTSFDSLSASDLSAITILNCQEKDIASISGIQNLANLVELNLNNNRIADISPLAGLDRLTILYLWHNRIADISPLAGLKQLKELYLESNEIEDISPVAKLNMLEELLLGDNRIIDIGPLAGLTKLDYLEIFNNRITDITSLKGLTRLEFLNASGNSIRDINALLNLEEITQLSLNDNSITDIKPLAGLKSVRRLFLGYNRISDISALANLAELKNLDLSANNIDDIAPLRNLNNLQRLTLDNNLVSDVSPLAGLPNLNYISLLNNCINNIGSFAQPGIITGMEYQHDLCSSPGLVKKIMTQEWLNEQINKQCEDYVQDSAKATHLDYAYCSDGLYYRNFTRNRDSDSLKRLVCHLPWDSDLGEFLGALETDADTTGSYRTYKYGNNVILYVQGDRIKGQSKKTRVSAGYEYELEAYMDIFKVRYEVERSELNGMEVLTARKNDHVVREIVGDEFHTLEFFEPGFYATEISKQQ